MSRPYIPRPLARHYNQVRIARRHPMLFAKLTRGVA